MTNDERPVITVREWAQINGVSERTAKFWAARGHLRAYQSGSTWLVRISEPNPGPMPEGAAAHRGQK